MVITTWQEGCGVWAESARAGMSPVLHAGQGDPEGRVQGPAYHGHDVEGHKIEAAPVGGLGGDAFLEEEEVAVAVSKHPGSASPCPLSPRVALPHWSLLMEARGEAPAPCKPLHVACSAGAVKHPGWAHVVSWDSECRERSLEAFEERTEPTHDPHHAVSCLGSISTEPGHGVRS